MTASAQFSSAQFDAIGTTWHIDTELPLTAAEYAAVIARIETFDRQWSRFRRGSIVDRIRSGPGIFRMPDDAGPLLALYGKLHELTDGAMSPAVGNGPIPRDSRGP